MNAIDVKLNYFYSKMEQIKKAKQEAMYLEDKFGEEFTAWLKENGVPENFTMVELLQHFRKKSTQIITP